MSSQTTLRKLTLLPLSKIYGMATAMRNKFFDWGWLKETEFDIPVIAVGNLSVGGTGKTPHTEYIVEALRNSFNIGILSRGYKRATKGFVMATPNSTPRDIGDEAYQMYHKFGRKVTVAVCEKRVEGINKMREINPNLNLIILDDGFQHRYVKPKVAVLLTEFRHPYYDDDMLPYGRLRESKINALRADIVIVTKCPNNVTPIEIRYKIRDLALIPEQDLFFTRYYYDNPRAVFPAAAKSQKTIDLETLGEDDSLLAVCGIANPRPFVRYVKSFKPRVKVNVFSDHHAYTRKDMELLAERFESMSRNGRRYILTTEKDAVRLINNPYFPHALKPYIYFIPIHVTFAEVGNKKFEDVLLKLLNKK